LDLILLKRDVYRHLLFNRGTGARMVYDAVGTKSSLPQEDEEDVKGQQKLTERDKEVVRALLLSDPSNQGLSVYTQARWKLIMRLGAALIWVDACTYPTPHLTIDNAIDVFDQSSDGLT
jgi:hypothetical protein